MEFGWSAMTLKVLRFILPVFLGALGGYLYYDFIGCNNGCAITGNPFISTAYGAAIGAVLVNWKEVISSFRKSESKEN